MENDNRNLKKYNVHRKKDILMFILACPGSSIYSVSIATGCGYRRCHSYVHELIKAGKVAGRRDEKGRKRLRLYSIPMLNVNQPETATGV